MTGSVRPRIDPGWATLWLAVATVVSGVLAASVGYFVATSKVQDEAAQAPSSTVTITVPGPTVTATETTTRVETTTDTAGARSTSTATSGSTTSSPRIQLTDVPPITDDYHPWETETVQVRGETIRNALVADTFYSSNDWTDSRHFPLNEKYTRLTGSVAIPDGEASGTEATIDIEVDGEIVVTGTLTLGQTPLAFDLNLTGTNDLKLHITHTEARGFGAHIVFINAWFTPA